MKSSELKKLIKEAVVDVFKTTMQDEIRSILRSELKDVNFLVEVLTEANSVKPTKYKPQIQEQTDSSHNTHTSKVKSTQTHQDLSNILQETSRSMNAEHSKPDMPFDTMVIEGRTHQVDKGLQSVFKKDYSQIMNELDV